MKKSEKNSKEMLSKDLWEEDFQQEKDNLGKEVEEIYNGKNMEKGYFDESIYYTEINYIPQGEDFVVEWVERKQEELKTKGGLLIPENLSEEAKKEFVNPNETEFERVVAVGPKNTELKLGDYVAIRYPMSPNAKMGIGIIIKGKEYVQYRGHEFIGKKIK